MSKSHSRRAILAGIAAAPALAAPALARSGPDPIYAAIENHRKAEAESLRLSRLEDDDWDGRTPELVTAIDAACDAAVNTRRSLAATVPTTPEGNWEGAWSLPIPDDMLTALVGTMRRLGAVL